VYLGASIRASLGLYRAAQALAVLEGRDYVVPDDVKRLAVSCLAHRILPRTSGTTPVAEQAEKIVHQVLEQTPLPA